MRRLPAPWAPLSGRWPLVLPPRSFCAKHDPRRRPPQYWHVVYDSGKPTPFVPIPEPFELEG
uniref:lysogeny maintenance protein PflM n=1 Tax=Pseudomonas citronellolis TaxID=53408 RepID=UPI003450B1B0